ncbi:MAG: hypothetical protein ACT4P4_05425, partial [Betaproteobacteria bacterium]
MRVTKRRFLGLPGAGLAGAPLPLFSQSSGRRRIGFLYAGSSWTLKRLRSSVIEGIAERGFQAPQHYEIHERFAETYVPRAAGCPRSTASARRCPPTASPRARSSARPSSGARASTS